MHAKESFFKCIAIRAGGLRPFSTELLSMGFSHAEVGP